MRLLQSASGTRIVPSPNYIATTRQRQLHYKQNYAVKDESYPEPRKRRGSCGFLTDARRGTGLLTDHPPMGRLNARRNEPQPASVRPPDATWTGPNAHKSSSIRLSRCVCPRPLTPVAWPWRQTNLRCTEGSSRSWRAVQGTPQVASWCDHIGPGLADQERIGRREGTTSPSRNSRTTSPDCCSPRSAVVPEALIGTESDAVIRKKPPAASRLPRAVACASLSTSSQRLTSRRTRTWRPSARS